MKTTFIYVLKDPRTDAIRYVGKSDNPVKRLSSHVGESRDNRCHRKTWIRSLKQLGLRPVVEIVDEVLESEWQALECAYIEYFRELGCDLTNNTAGGDGACDPSPEVRERQRICRLGKKLSVETCAKMSATRTRIKRKDNTSGFVGVCWNKRKGKWIARIFALRQQISLGYFKKIEDAVFAHSLAVDKYFPKIA